MIQAFDFFIHNLNRDSAAERKGRHASHRGIQIAEVALPRGARREREFEKPLSRLFAERDAVACLLSVLVEFELQVGLDVLTAADAVDDGGEPYRRLGPIAWVTVSDARHPLDKRQDKSKNKQIS